VRPTSQLSFIGIKNDAVGGQVYNDGYGGKKVLVGEFDLRAGNVVSGREVLANIAPVFNWPAAPGSASDTRFAQLRDPRRKYIQSVVFISMVNSLSISLSLLGHLVLRTAA
jgi:hypothetical protein